MKYDNLIRSGTAGVFAAPRLLGPLRTAARRAGVAWYDLGLAGVHDREGFLRRCAEVLRLPAYFGGNWDALHECLRDVSASGDPGAIVHWRGGAELARRAPEAVATALEILQDAAMYWAATGRMFLIVVDRDSLRGRDLSPLR